MSAQEDLPPLARGNGSLVFTVDGRTLIDLAMGFGAAFLGHAHPEVTTRVQAQVALLASSARHSTPVLDRAERLVSALLPRGLRLVGLYSTGMEVAEFALRIAATHTSRQSFAAFARSMHGKSAMTAALCWPNAPVRPGTVHTLPFVAEAAEDEILDALARLLRTRQIAALLIEPIQGSHLGLEASARFYREAILLCREYGTLSIFDEILTGLYRTGSRFYVDRLDVLPDIMLFAKCMGNGFPVSALALGQQIAVPPEALPESTFSGNPLAAAAVEGTLLAMGELAMEDRVGAIEEAVRAGLAPLAEAGLTLRGRGALWCLEFGDAIRPDLALAGIRTAGLLVTSAGGALRLLPAATSEISVLQDACARITRACLAARR